MKDKQFDHIIKNKLSGFISQVTPDWELFLEKKNIADNNIGEASFDASIKATLENHHTSTKPQWAAFLDHKAQADADYDSFDDQIKETVEGYETTTSPQWAAFLDHKAQADADHDSFDDQIKETVEGYETTTSPQWAAFLNHKVQADADYDSFDDQIKETVQGYETTTPPQWAAFLDHKAQADADYDSFDDQIKETVEGYETTTPPQWAAFLDHKAQADADYDSLDDQIKDTVDGYETNTQPQWEKFVEKRLAKADTGFDNKVFGSLDKLKVRYNSEHWLLLKARLQKIAYLRKQIFTYKSLEVIFLCLLLLTFGNFMGDINNYFSKDAQPIVSLEDVNNKNLTTETAVGEIVQVENSSSETKENESVQNAGHLTVDDSRNLNTTGIGTEVVSNTNRNASSIDETKNAIVKIPAIVTNDVTDNEEVLNSTLTTAGTNNSSATLLDATKADDKLVHTGLLAALDLVIPQEDIELPLQNNILAAPKREQYIDPNRKERYSDDGTWINVFGAMEDNIITTPFITELALPEKTRRMYGYKLEALVSHSKGAWEIESGLGYSMLNYEPYPGETVLYKGEKGYHEMTFTEVKLDKVHIPVKLKYHFVQNGLWSIFTHAGVDMDFLLKTNYIVEDRLRNPYSMGEIPPPAPEWPLLYEKDFTVGLFDNGVGLVALDVTTRKNYFTLRGNIGMGAERNISERFAAYVRADYMPTLYNNDFGPYNDRIRKVSFGMGFKMKL